MAYASRDNRVFITAHNAFVRIPVLDDAECTVPVDGLVDDICGGAWSVA